MSPKGKAGGFKYALEGILYCLTSQRNFKIQLTAAVVAVGLAFYFRLSAVEWMLLVLTIAAVLVAEIFNTAIETIVDLISPDYHPLAKIAKDTAAGAVLTTAAASVIIGYLLFFQRLFG